MMARSNRIVRPLRLVVLAIAPGSFCVSTPASADTKAGVNVSAGGSVETNPYLLNNGGGGTDVAGSLDVSPWLNWSDDISSLDFLANASLRRYAKNSNGTDLSGSASIGGSHRLSPYVSLSAGANYLTSRNGLALGFANVGPNDPLPPPTTPLPDITLGGTRTRTQTVSVNLGASVRISPLDQLGANITAARSTFDSPVGRDYTYMNTGLNYARKLSDRVSATASIRYGKSNYLTSNVGDGTIITPEVGVDVKLGDKLTLNASLGVSFSNSQLANGAKNKGKALSGQARLCYGQERGTMCVAAARSAQPSALGTIDTVTSISVNYDKRLTARDSITANAGFNSNKGNATFVTGPETSRYYNASASWNHNFNRRFSAYVSPSYSRITNSSKSYNSFRLSAGLRLSFGAFS